MGALLAALALTASLNPLTDSEPLPSRPLPIVLFVIPENRFVNFDLLDARAELSEPPVRGEARPNTVFGIKRHIGVGAGYDHGVLHGSLGLYLTIAELGRWNFGVPSPAVGFGRSQQYDPRRRQVAPKTETTILISLVSLHYRAGYLRSLGMNWYINLEQVFDARSNLNESQFGISLSRK